MIPHNNYFALGCPVFAPTDVIEKSIDFPNLTPYQLQILDVLKNKQQKSDYDIELATQILVCTHYDVLGVNENDKQSVLRNAYRNLAVKHHPDKGGDAAAFQPVNEANQVLSNDGTKTMYDAILAIARKIKLDAESAAFQAEQAAKREAKKKDKQSRANGGKGKLVGEA